VGLAPQGDRYGLRVLDGAQARVTSGDGSFDDVGVTVITTED
jgi:hypothetical protein